MWEQIDRWGMRILIVCVLWSTILGTITFVRASYLIDVNPLIDRVVDRAVENKFTGLFTESVPIKEGPEVKFR